MNVLVACEFSGIVRDAFATRGHFAVSCDLIESERPHGNHVQIDVRDLLQHTDFWDLMIAHPPCTHLASSGARWFPEKRADGRQQEGIDFFMHLADADIPRICIENPIGIMSTKWRKPDQIIQPYQFGHEARKSTCLWLKNLSLLQPTKIVEQGKLQVCKSGKTLPEWYSNAPKAERRKIRSRTFEGIASAMAEQWG